MSCGSPIDFARPNPLNRTIPSVVDRLYPGLIDELVPRARQSVHAHLRKLAAEGRVKTDDVDADGGEWLLTARQK